MMTIAIAIVAAAALTVPAPAAPKTPDFNGCHCHLGTVSQKRDHIDVAGPYWSGNGIIKGDMLWMTWTALGSGRSAIALYKIEDDRLVGHYAYEDEGAMYTESDICAQWLCSETLHLTRPEPQEPEVAPEPEPGVDQ